MTITPAQIDTFILTGNDVGEPDRIHIRSSNTGLGAAWALDRVDIISSATNQTYNFPFGKWVDAKNGLAHTIFRDGVVVASTDEVDYRIAVYTSDVR